VLPRLWVADFTSYRKGVGVGAGGKRHEHDEQQVDATVVAKHRIDACGVESAASGKRW